MKVVYVEDTVIPAAREWAEQLAQTMERDFVVVPADALDSPPNVGGTAKQIVRTSEERVPAGGGSMSRYFNSSTLTPAQLREDLLQKQRRLADSDALQRHLDEIQREAEQSTDTSAMERVFSKVCKKSNQTTNK